MVRLSPSDARPDGVAVLALDLDVRERSDGEARTAARTVAAQVSAARVFLKIDSTLRGPIAGLVAGALEGSGRLVAVVAPAFPEQGRVLVNGQLRLGNQAADGDRLHDRLQADLVGADGIEAAIAHGSRRVVVDAADGADLGRVAEAWRRHPEWLVVGSSGLARRVAGAARTWERRGEARHVLVVAGSPAQATRAQLARLPADPRVTVLASAATHERDTGQQAAALAEQVCTMSRPGGMILTGGQTARLVCQRLSVSGIELQGELEPGMPIGRLIGGPWARMDVVTKAGGFGGPLALLDAIWALGVSCQEAT
jgi:uncharacterized protein YgbK (DUF1537 family)